MGPPNIPSPSKSGRDGEGRNAIDPQKRTSITMLVLGDGTYLPVCSFISFVYVPEERETKSQHDPSEFERGRKKNSFFFSTSKPHAPVCESTNNLFFIFDFFAFPCSDFDSPLSRFLISIVKLQRVWASLP